jgi:hypothetical protein
MDIQHKIDLADCTHIFMNMHMYTYICYIYIYYIYMYTHTYIWKGWRHENIVYGKGTERNNVITFLPSFSFSETSHRAFSDLFKTYWRLFPSIIIAWMHKFVYVYPFLNLNCWVNIILHVCMFSEMNIWHCGVQVMGTWGSEHGWATPRICLSCGSMC